MATLLGFIEHFDPKCDDWAKYVDRFELCFLANEIEELKQTAVFLTVIRSKTYTLLRNLFTPEKPATKPIHRAN